MDEELLDKLSKILADKNIDLNQVLENFQATPSENNEEHVSSDNSQIDTEKIIKIQKLLKLLNSKNGSNDTNLLMALKPYLRDSKKTKVDEYIKILHMIEIFENFQKMGGNISDLL